MILYLDDGATPRQLLHLAVAADLRHSPTPPHIQQDPDFGTVIEWEVALQLLHFRTPGGSECEATWGSSFLLVVLYAANCLGQAPAFQRRLQTAFSLFGGAPYVTTRSTWERAAPTPIEEQRRLLALRRHAALWLRREPATLLALQRWFEAEFPSFARRATDGRTRLRPALLAEVEFDAVRPPGLPPPPRLAWDPVEEFHALTHVERHGAVRTSPHGARATFFVKLGTYVRNVWDLREKVPFGDYREAVGEIPPEDLARGVERARKWLDEAARPLPPEERANRLAEVGRLEDPEAYAAYAEMRGSGAGRPTERARVHRVKPPPALAARAGLPAELRVLGRGRKWLAEDQLGAPLDAVAEAWALRASGRSETRFRELHVATYFGERFVNLDALDGALDRVRLASLRAALAYVDPAEGETPEERSLARRLAAREAGKRVRLKLAFTAEEDAVLAQAAQPRPPTALLAELGRQMPKHAAYRVRARLLLWLELRRAGVDVAAFHITPESVQKVLGRKESEKHRLAF